MCLRKNLQGPDGGNPSSSLPASRHTRHPGERGDSKLPSHHVSKPRKNELCGVNFWKRRLFPCSRRRRALSASQVVLGSVSGVCFTYYLGGLSSRHFMYFHVGSRGVSHAPCSHLSCRRSLVPRFEEGAGLPHPDDIRFQGLDFLIRDWEHFDDGFTVDKCEQQVIGHLDRHMNTESAQGRVARGGSPNSQHAEKNTQSVPVPPRQPCRRPYGKVQGNHVTDIITYNREQALFATISLETDWRDLRCQYSALLHGDFLRSSCACKVERGCA